VVDVFARVLGEQWGATFTVSGGTTNMMAGGEEPKAA
jgi:hypothetical protein